jgi:branched-chain amino acid transport system permease protein
MTSPMSKPAMLGCLLVLIALAVIPLLGDKHAMDVTVEIMILALFALSLNVLIGYSGNVSFGHAAYFAIGGYTNAILLTTYNVPLIIAMPVAILFAMVAAMFVAWFCTRLTDIYFAMLTLAFAMLVWAILFKWRGMTNGDDGFVGITIPSFLDGRIPLYYFTLIVRCWWRCARTERERALSASTRGACAGRPLWWPARLPALRALCSRCSKAACTWRTRSGPNRLRC